MLGNTDQWVLLGVCVSIHLRNLRLRYPHIRYCWYGSLCDGSLDVFLQHLDGRAVGLQRIAAVTLDAVFTQPQLLM